MGTGVAEKMHQGDEVAAAADATDGEVVAEVRELEEGKIQFLGDGFQGVPEGLGGQEGLRGARADVGAGGFSLAAVPEYRKHLCTAREK